MQLSLTDRRVGDATVITCRGRIVAGKEAASLQHKLDALIPRSRHLVLHLGEVDFIDSSGLGLLVRYLVRARHGSGTLSGMTRPRPRRKSCAPSRRLSFVRSVRLQADLKDVHLKKDVH